MPSRCRATAERFSVLYRAELARRSGRVVAGCVATVVTLAVMVGTTNTRAVTPIGIASAGRTAAAIRDIAPVHGDAGAWLASARHAAATCPGLPAEVLVAIGQLETRLGVATGPSPAGALGPMQFLPSTWEAYGSDGDGDGIADIMNPRDALHGAARLLCANGGGDPERLRSAIWNYNRSQEYVDRVARMAGLPN